MKNLKKFCVSENSTIKEAIYGIQTDLCRCVIVLNDHNKVTGVFSEGDVLRLILSEVDIHTPLKKVIKPSFFYLKDRNFEEAFRLVKKFGITLIPVVDEDFNLKDVITIFDILDQLTFKK